MGSNGDGQGEFTGGEVEEAARTAKVAEDGQQQWRGEKEERDKKQRRGKAAKREVAKRKARRTHDIVGCFDGLNLKFGFMVFKFGTEGRRCEKSRFSLYLWATRE